jgi:hypothetical protein
MGKHVSRTEMKLLINQPLVKEERLKDIQNKLYKLAKKDFSGSDLLADYNNKEEFMEEAMWDLWDIITFCNAKGLSKPFRKAYVRIRKYEISSEKADEIYQHIKNCKWCTRKLFNYLETNYPTQNKKATLFKRLNI